MVYRGNCLYAGDAGTETKYQISITKKTNFYALAWSFNRPPLFWVRPMVLPVVLLVVLPVVLPVALLVVLPVVLPLVWPVVQPVVWPVVRPVV